ncbi:MAG: SUKH-4 family immunity protein [Deltaproteobacteria bacterium]|nr:SUKH-4 family immunity protein [Deltaproteobacteria bacterium]
MCAEINELMTGEAYRRRAGELGLELQRMPPGALQGLAIEDAERAWLTEQGLPRFAPPFLVFGDFDGRWLPELGSWSWLEDRKVPKSLAKRRVLGIDSEERPICLPETEPAVVALDPGRDFEPIWVNAGIQAMACCCLACQEMHLACEHLDCVPPERVGELERKIRVMDPSALRPGAFWAMQVHAYLNPLMGQDETHYLERQRDFVSNYRLADDANLHMLRVPVDKQGLGNRSERLRQGSLICLFLLWRRLEEQVARIQKPLQLWIEVGEEDAGQDCVVVHGPGAPEQVFPWVFEGVQWDLPAPAFLIDSLDEDLQIGRGGDRWVMRRK